MKTETKLMTLAGAQLALNALALAVAPTAAEGSAGPVAKSPTEGPLTHLAGPGTIRPYEQSFLDVPRACKDRSAAFDPVNVGREPTATAILAIHRALDTAAAQPGFGA